MGGALVAQEDGLRSGSGPRRQTAGARRPPPAAAGRRSLRGNVSCPCSEEEAHKRFGRHSDWDRGSGVTLARTETGVKHLRAPGHSSGHSRDTPRVHRRVREGTGGVARTWAVWLDPEHMVLGGRTRGRDTGAGHPQTGGRRRCPGRYGGCFERAGLGPWVSLPTAALSTRIPAPQSHSARRSMPPPSAHARSARGLGSEQLPGFRQLTRSSPFLPGPSKSLFRSGSLVTAGRLRGFSTEDRGQARERKLRLNLPCPALRLRKPRRPGRQEDCPGAPGPAGSTSLRQLGRQGRGAPMATASGQPMLPHGSRSHVTFSLFSVCDVAPLGSEGASA